MTVIGITGPGGSGKSALAAAFQKQGFVVVKFAGLLKDMARAFYFECGYDNQIIETYIEGHLKETANYHVPKFVRHQGVQQFVWAMTDVLCRRLGCTEEQANNWYEPTLTEWMNKYVLDADSVSPREFMQWLGTEWGRDMIGKDFWINAWLAEVRKHTNVVCDDCRFLNEADAIKSLNGVIVRRDRPQDFLMDNGGHSSESGLPDEMIDFVVGHQSTLGDLETHVDQILLHNDVLGHPV